jgi:hypothetical protein
MPLTAAQTTAFFQDAAQMSIPNPTVVQLRDEGITIVDDLSDFDKETIEQIAANLRRPGGRIPDPNPGAVEGATIATPPFVLGAKSQQRLIHAADLVRFYTTVGRNITAGNLQWTSVMKHFSEQWKALKDMKGDDKPEVPKITKALPIMKWTEAFRDYLNRVVGVRNIPLAYVIRPEADVPAIGAQAAGTPHSVEHGSIEAELVARASHGHSLFSKDNTALYHAVEEATRATQYAASIKPFQKTKDGRGAFNALTKQYAGKDKHEAVIKHNEKVLHTAEWKGQSNFSLEKFIAQHRNAFVSLQGAAEHVTYQLPNEHSRVGYLLDAIQCNDAGLQAAMASIKTDQTADGLRNDFEASATHLLPYDPVQKKRNDGAGTKRGSADISDMNGEEANVSSFGAKKGTGSTGVSFRYYRKGEYKKLSKEEKDELREWREKHGSTKGSDFKGKSGKSTPKNKSKSLVSAVEKKVAERIKFLEEEKANEGVTDALIMSIVKKYADSSSAKISDVEASSNPTLKSILKRTLNGKS